MKYILNKNSILIILSVLIVFGGIWAVNEFNFVGKSQAAVSYRVNTNSTTKVDEHGICKNVTNSSSGPDTLVPTNTILEWTLFGNNKPGNITLATCSGGGGGGCVGDGGAVNGCSECCSGFCFYDWPPWGVDSWVCWAGP